MNITGLENDYYLAGNDIWLTASGTASPSRFIDVEVTNETSGETLAPLRPYPNPNDEYFFNISLPVRALFPEPDHIAVNALQKITVRITATLENDTTEISTFTKYFLRGSKNKRSTDEWYLSSASPLIVAKWVNWIGIALPTEAYKLQGNGIVQFIPTVQESILLPNRCSPTIVRFLNSLGGYQYWVFEKSERTESSKTMKSKNEIVTRLRGNVSRSLGVTSERDLVLSTKTPVHLQDIISDLIVSPDIYMYDPTGDDNLSRWQRLELSGTNKTILNNIDRVYINEIGFSLPNYKTIEL